MAALASRAQAEHATPPAGTSVRDARPAALRPGAADLVSRGQELARAGHRAAAYAHFVAALALDPRHEDAWLWRAGTAEQPSDALDCLEQVLRLNPANASARLGLEQVRSQAAGTDAPRPPSPGRDRRRRGLAAKRTLLLSLLLATSIGFTASPGTAGSSDFGRAGASDEIGTEAPIADPANAEEAWTGRLVSERPASPARPSRA
jgi:tetratricopeptide (TPR) repeat protein